jgi:hypothetical protein
VGYGDRILPDTHPKHICIKNIKYSFEPFIFGGKFKIPTGMRSIEKYSS